MMELVLTFNSMDDAEEAARELRDDEEVSGVEVGVTAGGMRTVNATIRPMHGFDYESVQEYCHNRYRDIIDSAHKSWAIFVKKGADND